MKVVDKLLVRLLCKIVQILPVVLGRWPYFPGQELNIPKVLIDSQFDPVVKFTLGPFENLNDEFYKSNQYIKAMNSNSSSSNSGGGGSSREIQEKLTKFKGESYTKERKTEKEEFAEFQKRYNGNSNRFNIKKEISVEDQNILLKKEEEESSKSIKNIKEKLKGIKNDIVKLQKITERLRKIKEDLKNYNSDFCSKMLENLLQILKSSNRKLSKAENKEKIPNEYRSLSRQGFKSMNNITYNNQYQIGNIFIFNRLSEKKKGSISNFNEYKEPEDEIFYKSTENNMKALSGKKMNNLKDEPKSETAYESLSEPITSQQLFPTSNTESAFVKELKANFSKIFLSESVTLEQLNRMSKIVDFVERYHGIINDSNYLEDFEGMKGEPYVNYDVDKKNEDDHGGHGKGYETLSTGKKKEKN